MPNHVTTKCTVLGPSQDIEAFRAEMFSHDKKPYTAFDFNKIIPMPEILRNTESGTTADYGRILINIVADQGIHNYKPYDGISDYAGIYASHWKRYYEAYPQDLPMPSYYDLAKNWLENNPEYKEKGEQVMRATLETGYSSWYPWACDKWGTKWNSYSYELVSEDPFTFKFDTAWSFPTPVFEALIEKYPTLSFECATFDEGWNFACKGVWSYKEVTFQDIEPTDELYEEVYGEKPYHSNEE